MTILVTKYTYGYVTDTVISIILRILCQISLYENGTDDNLDDYDGR